jgi:hypothetical protein
MELKRNSSVNKSPQTLVFSKKETLQLGFQGYLDVCVLVS